MVNARRVDPIVNREFPIRGGYVRRREILRQQRTGVPVVRRLFIDSDEIPDEVARANNQEELPFEFSFAPLSPERNIGIPVREDTEPSGDYPDDLSDCSTIELPLDESGSHLTLALLNAWERNAEIRPMVDTTTQTTSYTPPGSPSSPSDHSYTPPNYSPIPPEEFEEYWDDLTYNLHTNNVLDFVEDNLSDLETVFHY